MRSSFQTDPGLSIFILGNGCSCLQLGVRNVWMGCLRWLLQVRRCLARCWTNILEKKRCRSSLESSTRKRSLSPTSLVIFIKVMKEWVLLKNDFQSLSCTYCGCVSKLSCFHRNEFPCYWSISYTASKPHTKAPCRHHPVASWYPLTFQTISINGNPQPIPLPNYDFKKEPQES